MAVGRKPRTADIGVDSVGLEPGRPVPVDDALRAAGVPGGWLYAIGDVNGRAPLTHMGKYHARVAVDAVLGHPASARAGHRAIPRVTFTDPQVASVGLTTAQAYEQGLSVRTAAVDLADVAAAPIIGERIRGTAQLVVADDGEVVVGATFTGPNVGEMLHAATIAIVGEVPMSQLQHAVAAFPTLSEMWLELFLRYQPRSSTPTMEGAQR